MKKFFLSAIVGLGCMAAIGSVHAAGNLERANNCGVQGWACDPADPSHTGQVLIYLDDGRLVRALTPHITREAAVGAACNGSSNRGFAGDLDTTPGDTFAYGNHDIHVYFQKRDGSLTEIGNSPKTVLFGPAQFSPAPAECYQPNGWGY
jgi:hypothetical protein